MDVTGPDGVRNANPAMSGSDPGRPNALETRPMIGVDSMGSPTPAGANRSRDPCARMPTG